MANVEEVKSTVPPPAVTTPTPPAPHVDPDDVPDRVLTADEILGTEDLKPVKVKVPEWKGVIFIRQLSASEGQELADEISGNGVKHSNTKTLLRCASDAVGNRIFTDTQLAALKRKSLKVVNRLAIHALRVNGLLKESALLEAEAAKND